MTAAKTYRATGINLKGSPLGEADVLLTILTAEQGLLRAVAPGARKPKSKIGGRTGLFVVNHLALGRGRSLDRIHQAEAIASYPRLSEDLGKLTAGQYLAEMALHQALSEQPQVELFGALTGAIAAVEAVEVAGGGDRAAAAVLAALAQGIYELLAIAGVTPQVVDCALSQVPLSPPTEPGAVRDRWRVGFSAAAGGVVSLEALAQVDARELLAARPAIAPAAPTIGKARDRPPPSGLPPVAPPPLAGRLMPLQLDATDLAALRSLARPPDDPPLAPFSLATWVRIERSLRHYTQYHFGKPIRSAALLDTYVRR